jgi:YggT family protein
MHSLLQAFQFIFTTLITAFITLLLLRFLLQAVRANFYNPLCQFIVKVTNPILLPLRRFIPGFFGIDWATILLVLTLSFFNQAVLVLLSTLVFESFWGVFLLALSDILKSTYYVYFFSLIALAFSSWFSPGNLNPMMQPLVQLLSPILVRIQRHLKPVGGFDLSSLVLILGLAVINIVIIQPLHSAGIAMLGGG